MPAGPSGDGIPKHDSTVFSTAARSVTVAIGGLAPSHSGRFRPAITSPEPARAASRPKGRSEAEKAKP